MSKDCGYVYFIKCKNKVKIGYSTNIKRRIKELATGNGEKLELIYSIPGSKDTEWSLHNYFSFQHICGEWFELYPEIQMWIDYDKLSRKVLREEGIIK
jgi:hypothetical protein